MSSPGKADPAIYPELRKRALHIRVPEAPGDSVNAVLMDWPVSNGTTTVLAAADGTASIYLSSGGGFIGGSQAVPAIRTAALRAVQLAQQDHGDAHSTTDIPLPAPGTIFFYFVRNEGLLLAQCTEASLRDGTTSLANLGEAMQRIITEYRLRSERRDRTRP